MIEKIEQESTFPFTIPYGPGGTVSQLGLTKREYFAAMALTGLATRLDSETAARPSVKNADALIAELNKQDKRLTLKQNDMAKKTAIQQAIEVVKSNRSKIVGQGHTQWKLRNCLDDMVLTLEKLRDNEERDQLIELSKAIVRWKSPSLLEGEIIEAAEQWYNETYGSYE